MSGWVLIDNERVLGMLKLLGLLLAATPFVVVTMLIVGDLGWRYAVIIWGLVAACVGFIYGGVLLFLL